MFSLTPVNPIKGCKGPGTEVAEKQSQVTNLDFVNSISSALLSTLLEMRRATSLLSRLYRIFWLSALKVEYGFWVLYKTPDFVVVQWFCD